MPKVLHIALNAHATAAASLSNAAKLAQDNNAIGEGMKEAGQKAANAMSAANTGMILGVVGGATSVGASVSEFHVLREPAHNPLTGSLDLKSDALEHRVNAMETQIQQADAAAEKGQDATDTTRDRRKAGLDNIQKLLDILRSMNPKI